MHIGVRVLVGRDGAYSKSLAAEPAGGHLLLPQRTQNIIPTCTFNYERSSSGRAVLHVVCQAEVPESLVEKDSPMLCSSIQAEDMIVIMITFKCSVPSFNQTPANENIQVKY